MRSTILLSFCSAVALTAPYAAAAGQSTPTGLAYQVTHSFNLDLVPSEVFLADSDGGNLRNLTDHFSYEGWPAWSPDWRRIAFSGNRGGNYQIFLMKADGSDVRRLANTNGRATSPKWAADGQAVYFTNCQNVDFGVGCEIMRVDLE